MSHHPSATARVLDLARSGKTAEYIRVQSGVPLNTIRGICARHGVKLARASRVRRAA